MKSLGGRTAAAFVLGAIAFACSSKTDNVPADGGSVGNGNSDSAVDSGPADTAVDAGHSGCSTGSPHQLLDNYPVDPAPGEPPLPNWQCVPRCEYKHGDRESLPPRMLYLDALPSGACEVPNERCYMTVRALCSCGEFGPVWDMRCTCESTWKCAIIGEPGAAGCDCPADSGTD